MSQHTVVESVVYIPMDRRHALARGTSLPDRALGTALFADISGFTPLTEALARELGPQRGAEELTRQLNLIYDALIAQVDRYGGSVVGFSGDAITCWLDEGQSNQPGQARPVRSTFRAAACAFDMQAAMSRFAAVTTPSGLQVPLAMKVAIASGPVRRFLVGDPDIQVIDALAGATLDRLAATEHLANRHEVLISAEAIELLGEAATIVEWRGEQTAGGERAAVVSGLTVTAEPAPWPELPAEALTQEQIRPWLTAPVYERLGGGQGAFLTELRPAVAEFVHFEGIEFDADPTAGDKLDAYVRRAQKILTQYEGALLQLTIGEKGNFLYAAFGAPVAHEDDARRAALVALELQVLPPELSFIQHVRIGISRGTMRTGDYGGTTRRTYGVLGDEVNLAARLMQNAASGKVLVSQRIHKSLADAFQWETLTPIQVKGKTEPIPVFYLLGARPKGKAAASAAPITIIGRELEQSLLSESVQRLAGGVGGLIIIEGEAGMGKGLLGDYVRQQATVLNLAALSGAAIEVDKAIPYNAWRSIFTQLLGASAAQDQSDERAHLEQALADQPDVLRFAPLLNPILSFDLPETPLTLPITGQERAQITRQLLTQLLEHAANQCPLVVVLEDAHWLDSLSWELVTSLTQTLIASGAPLLLTLVTRPVKEHGPASWSLEKLMALPETRTLKLGPLSPAATVAIAAARLDVPDDGLPAPVAELIGQQADGNPFYAEEMILTLRDQGLVCVDPDPARAGQPRSNRCALTGDLSTASRALPDTIQGLILARIDRLMPDQQLTLKVSSAIGRTFGYWPLRYTLKQHAAVDDENLQFALEDLSALDFIAQQVADPDPQYLFEQITTQEAAYQTLLFALRQQLHRAIAEWYEFAFAGRLDEFAETLAYHYTRAGVDDRAIDYLLKAGARARGLYALREAIEHYQAALQRLEPLPPAQAGDRTRLVHAELGELFVSTSQLDNAQMHLNQALTLAVESGDQDAQARACRWLARLNEMRGEYPPALDWVRRGLEALEGRETAETSELLLIAGLIHTRQGDYASALDECQTALIIAEAGNALSAMARAHTLLGHVARLRGDRVTAIERFQHALGLYERIGDLNGQAVTRNQMANAYFDLGDWAQAKENYAEARRISDKIGDAYRRAQTDNNLGGILRNQGRLAAALMSYQGALNTFEKIGSSLWIRGVLNMNLGGTYALMGQLEQARQHLESSRDYFEQAKSRDFLPEMYRYLAVTALQAHDLGEAEAQGQQALSLARELEMRGEEGNSLRVLGEVALAQNQFDQAEARLRQSIAILEEIKDEYERARSQLALARLRVAQDQPAAARETLGQCLPTFERLGASLDLAAAQALQSTLA